jgi:polar amino acid transport system substrate-binding protein
MTLRPLHLSASLRVGLAAFLALALGSPAPGQTPTPTAVPASGRNLTVVTRKVTPFVIEKNGHLTGYSIELWERIVRDAHLPFDPDTGYRVVENVQQMLDELREGRADAGVAAVSITSEREQTIDFSYPFKESGLQILTKDQPRSSFAKIVSSLFTRDILWLLGGLVFVLILNSHIIWLFERKKNPESFPEGYVAGLWEAIWWSLCTIITGGCENKAPLGVAGRLTAIVWMLAGAALFTYITATITSAMTVDTLNSDIKDVADLKAHKWTVGTLAGSTAQKFLEAQGLAIQSYQDVESACAAVADDKVKAVIYDAPILQYYAKNNPDKKLDVVGELFEKQSYGIGVPQGSQYRKEITRTILALREQGFFNELENKYFGTSSGSTATAR